MSATLFGQLFGSPNHNNCAAAQPQQQRSNSRVRNEILRGSGTLELCESEIADCAVVLFASSLELAGCAGRLSFVFASCVLCTVAYRVRVCVFTLAPLTHRAVRPSIDKLTHQRATHNRELLLKCLYGKTQSSQCIA